MDVPAPKCSAAIRSFFLHHCWGAFFLNAYQRRRRAASTPIVALAAAGLLCVAVPGGAQAASPLPDTFTGHFGLLGGSTGVELANGDGSGLTEVPNFHGGNSAPAWAPDGSRVMMGGGSVVSGRINPVTDVVTVKGGSGLRSSNGQENPVYFESGRFVVYSSGGQLASAPSDGSVPARPLLTADQEPSSVCDLHPAAPLDAATLAFERRTGSCTGPGDGIWTFDDSTHQIKQVVSAGTATSPAMSADGTQLAFTEVVDGWSQLFVSDVDGSNVKQLTNDASDHTDPSWDPGGSTLVYDAYPDHATATPSVKTFNLVLGTSSAALTQPGQGSKPTVQPLRKNAVLRVYGTGTTPIDTAASRWTYDTVGGTHVPGLIAAHSAVLTNKDNATYATTAIALGSEKDGPVLMTSAGSLDATAAAELKRILPAGGTVYLNGNTSKLSSTVADQVAALGYTVLRMDGSDLSAISVRTAKQIAAKPTWVFIADGSDYHDPIAAASAAGAFGYHGTGVLVLTNGTTMESSVSSYLDSLDLNSMGVVTVGANAATALQHAPLHQSFDYLPITGATDEDVAANLARFWWSAPPEATVEDTWTWQNAVAGQAASAVYGPLLWSTEGSLSSQDAYYLGQGAASISSVQMFGGNVSYPLANRTAVGNAIAVDSSWTDTYWFADGAVPAAAAPAARSSRALPPTQDGPRPTQGATHPVPDPNAPRLHPVSARVRHVG
jgi:hypothetical protein